MKFTNFFILAVVMFSFANMNAAQSQNEKFQNPNIDAQKFKKDTKSAMSIRESRRISEDQFINMSKEKDTIILDTRSERKFKGLHIAGATHLNFSDITKDTLAKAIPNKDTRILIYCNNNFEDDEKNFPIKDAPAALNLSTFTTLYTYGYHNVYELGPLLNTKTTKIKLKSMTQ